MAHEGEDAINGTTTLPQLRISKDREGCQGTTAERLQRKKEGLLFITSRRYWGREARILEDRKERRSQSGSKPGKVQHREELKKTLQGGQNQEKSRRPTKTGGEKAPKR